MTVILPLAGLAFMAKVLGDFVSVEVSNIVATGVVALYRRVIAAVVIIVVVVMVVIAVVDAVVVVS